MGIFSLNSFWLPVNGNGGFVGNILTQTFLENLILTNQEISYYILILITTLLFLKSINFSPMGLISFIKKIKTRNVSDKITENQFESSEVINTKQIKMNIEGMICAVGCAAMIEKNLNKTDWIKFANVT